VKVTGIDVNSFEKFDVKRVIGPAKCMSAPAASSGRHRVRPQGPVAKLKNR
jgi:hypothetical protein